MKKLSKPEQELKDFIGIWNETLWAAMSATGKGYKKDSLKHTGKKDDRRKNKLLKPGQIESKFQRRCRLKTVGMKPSGHYGRYFQLVGAKKL